MRLLAVLLATLVIGGAGAVFVWSSFNAVVEGDAGWPRGIAMVVVALAEIALLLWVGRVIHDLEGPR